MYLIFPVKKKKKKKTYIEFTATSCTSAVLRVEWLKVKYFEPTEAMIISNICKSTLLSKNYAKSYQIDQSIFLTKIKAKSEHS